jgi:phospholipid/cholesterol/gamma-HCH transport system substrate-binding protein
MRRGGRVGTLAASPTLVGAVTVLVIVVAVFLAYQANQGLPFVPTYKLSAELPNAAAMVPGNEVRIGGTRVGQINQIEPIQNDDTGAVSAKVDMELNQDLDPLPEDSTVIVRSRSALGLKYLEIQRGDSTQGFGAGETMPLSAARPEPVEIDQVFNTFDEPTRAAIQTNLLEFGNALAGRGVALNAAIGDLRPLVERLEPVMRNLASPDTGLSRFVSALAATAAEAAPVAEIQGQLFVDLETTFRAFADVARPFIQETISKAPETEDTAIDTLPRIRPFLANTAVLFGELRPGFHVFAPVSKEAAQAVSLGTKALRISPALNAQLDPTAQSLLDLNNDPVSREGIRDLTAFNNVLSPPLAFITPAQSVCNYATIFLQNFASMTSFGDGLGTNQRAVVLQEPIGPNGEVGPSSAPASGGSDNTANFLHYNPYPNTASPGQVRECEAGNEVYNAGQVAIGNVPGNQGTRTSGQIQAQTQKSKKKGGKR